MKTRMFGFGITVFLAAIPVLGAETIRVSKAAGDSIDPRVEVSETAKEIFVVWQDQRTGASGLYFRCYNAEGIPQTDEIRWANSGSKPVLAVGTDQRVRVAWLQGSTVYLAILNSQGLIVSGPTRIENNAWQPNIAIGPENVTNLVYEHHRWFSHYVVFASFDADGKGPICRLVIDNGDIIGDKRKQPDVWTDDFNWSAVLFYDRFGFEGHKLVFIVIRPDCRFHTPPIRLNAETGCCPVLAFSPPDPVTIYTFYQGVFQARPQIYSQIYGRGSQHFCPSVSSAQKPKTACSEENIAHLVWQDNRYGNWEILLGRQNAEGSQLACQRITETPTDSLNPDVAILDNQPVVVWQEKQANGFEIYLQGDFPEPLETQLKIYDPDSQLWLSTTNPAAHFDPSYGTAVIVHGWNIDRLDSLNDTEDGEQNWTLQVADKINIRLSGNVNILAWDWLDQAEGPLEEVTSRIKSQATLLAHELRATLPRDYDKPIHIMGHSLGTLLSAQTCIELLRNSIHPDQLTLWDPPDTFLGLVRVISNLTELVTALRGENIYVDLYDGFTSNDIHSANLWVNVPGLPHGTYSWYQSTIPLTSTVTLRSSDHCLSDVLPGQIGFGASILLAPPDNPDSHRVQVATCKEQGTLMFSKLSICSRLTEGDVFGLDETRDCQIAEPPTLELTAPTESGVFDYFDGIDWFDNGCDCGFTNPTALYLSTNPLVRGKMAVEDEGLIARYQLEIAIGTEHDYLSFEHDFTEAPTTATLEASIITGGESHPFFVMTSEPVLAEDFLDSGLFDISSLHGQTVTLQFELKSAEPGSRVNIQNINLWRDQYNGNQPPIANAGADQVIAVNDEGVATIILNGTSTHDPDKDDTLQLWWMRQGELLATGTEPTIELPVGVYLITLNVRDNADNVSTDEVIVEVEYPFTRGDCSPDRQIDIGDAISILAYLFLNSPVKCQDACDTNDSGQIDLADAIYILNYLFVSGPTPPIPFLGLGLDPTPEGLGCNQY